MISKTKTVTTTKKVVVTTSNSKAVMLFEVFKELGVSYSEFLEALVTEVLRQEVSNLIFEPEVIQLLAEKGLIPSQTPPASPQKETPQSQKEKK